MSNNSIFRRNITLLGFILIAAVLGGFFYKHVMRDVSVVLNETGTEKVPVTAWFLSSEEGEVTDVSVSGKMLYLAKDIDGNGMGGDYIPGKDLVIKDVNTGEKKTIATNILEARFSPDGIKVVVSNINDEVKIIDTNGNELEKIGKHGSGPIFSPDGNSVIYHKLADEGQGQDLFEYSTYGLVQYSIKERNEKVLTSNKDDYEPLGFSYDLSKLYFNSARAYDSKIEGYENHVVSLWVLDLKTGAVTRLTNLDEEKELQNGSDPRVTRSALWSTDKKTIISEADGEIWKFVLSTDGSIEKMSKLAEGTDISWDVVDQSINVLVNGKTKPAWKTVSVN